ncbi:MAG: hypothetical protein ACMUIU_00515 [bacterium]
MIMVSLGLKLRYKPIVIFTLFILIPMLFVRYLTIRIVGKKIDQALKNKTFFVTNIVDNMIEESHKNLIIIGRFLSNDSMIQQSLTSTMSVQILRNVCLSLSWRE